MLYKKYNKKFDFSYTYGVNPTLDLLLKNPGIVRTVLLHPTGDNDEKVHKLKELCSKNEIRYEIAPRAIEKISVKENTYAIGVFNKYETELSSQDNHIVLVNVSSPGNLGTIIRSMVGFDFANLSIIRPATDVFDPKVVRSSMGSIFDLNFEYFNSFEKYTESFSSHHLYPFLLNGEKSVNEISFEKPFSLIFGNESNGLSEHFENIGTGVYIPQSKTLNSLNLAIAAGIGMYVSSN